MPLLVDRADLAGAVSLNSVMINASRVIGPALAAVLALFGVTTSQLFLVNAATYLFLIAAIVVVHIPDVRGTPPRAGLAAAADRPQHRPPPARARRGA